MPSNKQQKPSAASFSLCWKSVSYYWRIPEQKILAFVAIKVNEPTMVRDVTLTIVLNRRGRMSRREDQTFAGQLITIPETQIAENSTCRVLRKVSTREEVIPSGFDDVEGRRRVLGNRADRRSSFLLSRRTAAIALARVRACEDLPVRLPASRRQTTRRSSRRGCGHRGIRICGF